MIVCEPVRRRPLVRARRKWENVLRINHKEINRESLDLIKPVQSRVHRRAFVNTLMNLKVP
jgi:hypothetical protein